MIAYSKRFAVSLVSELSMHSRRHNQILIAGSAPMYWALESAGIAVQRPADLDIFVNNTNDFHAMHVKIRDMLGAENIRTGDSIEPEYRKPHIHGVFKSVALGLNVICTNLIIQRRDRLVNGDAYANVLFNTFDCNIAQIALTRNGSTISSNSYRDAIDNRIICFSEDTTRNRITKYINKFRNTDFEVLE